MLLITCRGSFDCLVKKTIFVILREAVGGGGEGIMARTTAVWLVYKSIWPLPVHNRLFRQLTMMLHLKVI